MKLVIIFFEIFWQCFKFKIKSSLFKYTDSNMHEATYRQRLQTVFYVQMKIYFEECKSVDSQKITLIEAFSATFVSQHENLDVFQCK